MVNTTYELTESVASALPLDRHQAIALQAVGRQLASRLPATTEDSDKSAIECSTSDGVSWRVLARNAVGIIGLPDGVRVVVRPKIPVGHLMHLLWLGGAVPRTAPTEATFSPSDDFHELIAGWYMSALESVLRSGLLSSYVLQEDRLPVVRGRLDVPRTTVALARGTLRLSCEFEEFTQDTALNRVLAAATKRIARSRLMPDDLRQRARRAGYLLTGLSPMRPSDLQVQPDRTAARYTDAITLARLLLAGAGVGLESGDKAGSSFLLPTPLVVEAALRQLAAMALQPVMTVTKGRLDLADSGLTVNPDLVFGEAAVGDVKYKIWSGSWLRPDMYELIAFAAAYERTHAVHVGFGTPTAPHPLQVGQVKLWRVTWNSDPEVTPEAAAAAFQEQIRNLLTVDLNRSADTTEIGEVTQHS